MKKKIVSTSLNTSQVYKSCKYVKDFVAKYVIGWTIQAINNTAQIEAHLATLNRSFDSNFQAKSFTQCVKAKDESGRNYQLVGNPNTGDRVLTIRNAMNELIAKYGTSSHLIKYKKRG